jgi:hypothetical protein
MASHDGRVSRLLTRKGRTHALLRAAWAKRARPSYSQKTETHTHVWRQRAWPAIERNKQQRADVSYIQCRSHPARPSRCHRGTWLGGAWVVGDCATPPPGGFERVAATSLVGQLEAIPPIRKITARRRPRQSLATYSRSRVLLLEGPVRVFPPRGGFPELTGKPCTWHPSPSSAYRTGRDRHPCHPRRHPLRRLSL